jgi:hypothetical protein
MEHRMNPEPASAPNSIPALLRDLRDESTTLLRQEVALAKTEMKENVSRMGTHATTLATGGLVAYAGVIVLLIGVGHLLGSLLVKAGLDPQIAQWLAPSIVGLIVAIIGWVMVTKAKTAMSHDDLTPQKTIDSLRDNKQWAENKLNPSS